MIDIWPSKTEYRDSQIDHLCQFIDKIKDEEILQHFYEMASFKILEKYAELELESPFDNKRENLEKSKEFKENIAKYILIIDAIKRTLANRKDQ